MAHLTILIDGTDRTSNIDQKSVIINNDIEVRGDNVSMHAIVSGTDWVPVAGNTVEIKIDGATEFLGNLLTPEQTLINPTVFLYKFNVVDPTWLMDRKLIAKSFTGELAGDMIKAIVNSTADGELSLVADGFTTAAVDDGFAIPEMIFDYVSVSQAFDTIAGMIGYQWYIDETLDIHFFQDSENTAPVSEITATTIDIWDVSIIEDVSQIKNRIFIKDFSAKGSGDGGIDQSFTGDGISRFFPLTTGPWSAETTSILVEINSSPVGTQLEDSVASSRGDGLTATDTLFVCTQNWGIRFPDGSPLGIGDVMDVSILEHDAEDQIIMVEDIESQAIQAPKENSSDGVHEHVVSRPDLRMPSTDVATEFGNLVLNRYKDPIIAGEFETHKVGWKPGQFFDINWPERGFDNKRVFAISVEQSFIESDDSTKERWYKVGFSSTPYEITV